MTSLYIGAPSADTLPAATIDLMISAMARVRQATVVTRSVADFDVCGLLVVDPWAS